MKVILSYSTFLVLIFLSFLPSVSQAQKTQQQVDETRKKLLADPKVKSVLMNDKRQTPSFISLKSNVQTYSRTQVKPALDNYLGVREGIDATVLDKETKVSDKEVLEYQQFYKGVKVDRAKFKAYLKNGKLELMNGAWYNVPASLSVTPVLTLQQALSFAKANVNAKKYIADELQAQINATSDPKLRQALQAELKESTFGGQLVIIKDFSKTGVDEVRLAYKFNIYAAEPLSRSWVYVDAINGKILLVDAIIKHVNENPHSTTSVPTPVQTRYAGTRNIQVKQISGNDPHNGQVLVASNPTEIYTPGSATYSLIDDTRGKGVETYDLNGVGGVPLNIGAIYAQAKAFTDVDNNWSLPEHKRGSVIESENDDFGWDAHWGAGVVYDYWKTKQNRLSFDGKDGKIKSFIHSGFAFDNAYWNGSVMTYGDGSGTAANGFKPLTSLDVCGHEIGHGVCEFTADLVYAMESGAMNEGYSDIWAACVEYFAIKTIDPTLASVYKPFYIGEQIAVNPASPLRRMDNPKAKRDPDTYGGQYWTSQNCTPTLANDQCGVHNNSGVLNKWFYLLTVGSHSGSGPDAAFAGEDDGINDAVTTGPVDLQHPANTYQVTGLGFDVAEKISYLTELLLTTTATFAEAREVSIAVAADLSGNPCSPMVESVTNAWYAVGVGSKFVKPCTITYGFVMKNGAAVSENTPTNGCNAVKTYNIPVVLPPNGTASVTVSGTAGTFDYSLAATSITNSTTTNATQNFVVTIINDGSVEGDEFVQLALTVTNAGTNPVNNSFKLTILDDDVIPVIGTGESILLNETFTRADGFADPAGWTEILEVPESTVADPLAAGKNQWGIFDNKLAITGKDGQTGTQFPNGTYNNASPSQTIIKTPLLDARGLSVVKIKFDWTVQGEINAEGDIEDFERLPVFDYMALAYSLDGINFIELNTGEFRQYASVQPTSGTTTGTLPASLANKQFYLAFRWFNDTNAGGPFSASVDNVTVSAAPRTIENDLNHNGRENLRPQQEVYYYSIQDGQVITKVNNTSIKDLGCTNTFVEKTGNGAFNLYQNSQGLHKVSDKIIRIEAGVITKASTTVTLFFTESQLQGLEAATGQGRSSFSVYHVQDIAYTAAANNNTKSYTPVYTALPGVGGSYTISFNDRVNGSYALGMPVSVVGALQTTTVQSRTINSKEPSSKSTFGNLFPNPGNTDVYLMITVPQKENLQIELVNLLGQVIHRQRETVHMGTNKVILKTGSITIGKYSMRILNDKNEPVNTQKYIKQ